MDSKIKIKNVDEKSIDHIRHSLAHLLAAAVLKFDPNAKLGVGPTIEKGFYYDFLLNADLRGQKRGLTRTEISETNLPKIEEEIRRLAKQNLRFERQEKTFEEARKIFADQPFKLELINDLEKYGTTEYDEIRNTKYEIRNKFEIPNHKFKTKIAIYKTGNFIDLCRGGHVKNTKEIPLDAFNLTKIAGAYWRGSEKNQMLTRIYGVAFLNKKELDEYLKNLEEAKKRDHRKLGKDLQLFTIEDNIGPGLPMFYPKGAVLRRIVENFIISLQEKNGYSPIWIPHITKGELYKISGHLDKFDALYPPMELPDEDAYYLKPMNCPHFMVLYKSLPHSYKELPIRWTATTTNYRYEKSGELSGLTRVRSLTQDDCHVFARPDQIENEIGLMLNMIDETYKAFGFKDFWMRISTRDPNNQKQYIGDPEIWEKSEAILSNLAKKRKWETKIGVGEAAFYGPKLDFIFKDVVGREWQLSTIQLDMNLPKRFNLEYTDADGSKKQPIVIHRAILGATERFLGILIEHYGGAFPLWLAPVQIGIIPVSKKFRTYAQKVADELKEKNFRVELGKEDLTVGKQIREFEMQKLPYILVVGEKEQKQNAVAVRARGKGDVGIMPIKEFLKSLD